MTASPLFLVLISKGRVIFLIFRSLGLPDFVLASCEKFVGICRFRIAVALGGALSLR